MALVTVSVDVYCTRSENTPSYRVYVDEEMLTERSWTWPAYEIFIKEQIEVDLEPGAHRVSIRECNCEAVFNAVNFTVNGSALNNASGVFFV
jgi:hypothetical protein